MFKIGNVVEIFDGSYSMTVDVVKGVVGHRFGNELRKRLWIITSIGGPFPVDPNGFDYASEVNNVMVNEWDGQLVTNGLVTFTQTRFLNLATTNKDNREILNLLTPNDVATKIILDKIDEGLFIRPIPPTCGEIDKECSDHLNLINVYKNRIEIVQKELEEKRLLIVHKIKARDAEVINSFRSHLEAAFGTSNHPDKEIMWSKAFRNYDLDHRGWCGLLEEYKKQIKYVTSRSHNPI